MCDGETTAKLTIKSQGGDMDLFGPLLFLELKRLVALLTQLILFLRKYMYFGSDFLYSSIKLVPSKSSSNNINCSRRATAFY